MWVNTIIAASVLVLSIYGNQFYDSMETPEDD